jgi:hypothetical protein
MEEFAAGFKGPDVAVVSMYDIYRQADPAKEFADSAHLRAVGHARIARTIKDALLESGMLDTFRNQTNKTEEKSKGPSSR